MRKNQKTRSEGRGRVEGKRQGWGRRRKNVWKAENAFGWKDRKREKEIGWRETISAFPTFLEFLFRERRRKSLLVLSGNEFSLPPILTNCLSPADFSAYTRRK